MYTWEQFQQDAAKVSKETGYPLAVLLGQAAQETGRKVTSAPGNNFFGIKGQGDAGTQLLSTWEDYGQGRVETQANFAKFSSPEEAIKAYIRTIERLVPDWKNYSNEPDVLITKIKQAGYATDPAYVQNVMNTPEYKKNVNQAVETTTQSTASQTNQQNQSKTKTNLQNFFPNLIDKLIKPAFAESNGLNYSPLQTTNYSSNMTQTAQQPSLYTVKAGDTLWDIATKYLGDGSKWNQLGYSGDPTKMPIGTQIQVPNKSSQAPNTSTVNGPVYTPPSGVNQSYAPNVSTNKGPAYATPSGQLIYQSLYSTPKVSKAVSNLKPDFSLYSTGGSATMLK